jgi:hypothetical protein
MNAILDATRDRGNAINHLVSEAVAEVHALRDRIREMKALRADTVAAPKIKAERAADLDAVIADAGRQVGLGQDLVTLPGKLNVRDLHHKVSIALERQPFAVFAALAPELLREALLHDYPANGITDTARAAALAEIDDELEAVEIAEEVACRAMEKAFGHPYPRRTDVRPAIYLAPDRELGLG